MDIIKKTSTYMIVRTWLGIPASYDLDCWDIATLREDHDDKNTISSFLTRYPNRGWAYVAKVSL